MKIKITKAVLLDVLNKVQKVAPSRATLQIVQNVKMEANDGKLTATCTDLDITVVASATCEVFSDGEVTLPCKMLATAISKCADGPVEIDVDDATAKAVVKAGSAVFHITGLPAKDFPVVAEPEGDPIEIKSDSLREMFRKVKYAVSHDDTRASLQSVFMEFANGTVSAVATDGRRLAKYEVPASISADKSVLLPISAVEQIIPNIKGEGNCSLTLAQSSMLFAMGNVKVYTKLVDGAYPNYRQIIPAEFAHTLVINREDLIASIDRVSVFVNEGDNSSIEFTLSENQIVLKSKAMDIGESRDVLPAKFDTAEPIVIRLNPAYLLDAFKSLDEDDVEILVNSGTQPINVRMPGSTAFTYICMPLRIA